MAQMNKNMVSCSKFNSNYSFWYKNQDAGFHVSVDQPIGG